MDKLFYCHMCGKILEDKSDVYNITMRDVETHTEKKLFDTCRSCAKVVLNLKFKPVKLTPSMRKKPKFTSIIIKKSFTPRKEKLVYDVLPYQLDQIKSLEVNKDDLKLTYKSGARIYTEFQVKKWMSLKENNLIDAMMLVYKYQTEDEKKKRETKYANSVGFNKPDASFLTGMSRIYECKGYGNYTDKQLKRIEKTMEKYTKQVTLYVNADNMILEGV